MIELNKLYKTTDGGTFIAYRDDWSEPLCYWGCLTTSKGIKVAATYDRMGRNASAVSTRDLLLPRKVMVEITVPPEMTHVFVDEGPTETCVYFDILREGNKTWIPIDEWIASLEGGE